MIPHPTGQYFVKHPVRQPGDDLREAQKKAETMESIYLEIQRERDNLKAKSHRDDLQCQRMAKNHATQAKEIEKLKQQLAAAQAAQMSPAIQVGMAESMRLQQAVADGNALQVQWGKTTAWRPLSVVVTRSQNVANEVVARASPRNLQQDVLQSPVPSNAVNQNTKSKDNDLNSRTPNLQNPRTPNLQNPRTPNLQSSNS